MMVPIKTRVVLKGLGQVSENEWLSADLELAIVRVAEEWKVRLSELAVQDLWYRSRLIGNGIVVVDPEAVQDHFGAEGPVRLSRVGIPGPAREVLINGGILGRLDSVKDGQLTSRGYTRTRKPTRTVLRTGGYHKRTSTAKASRY